MSSTFAHISKIEEELKQLRLELKAKNHLTQSSEADYDLKSQIIDKQNEMIELLIKLANNKE